MFGDQSAEDRSHAGPQCNRHGTQAKGEPALGRGKSIRNDRDTWREEQRAAEPLKGASGDQQGE